jgi:hypothetical protein
MELAEVFSIIRRRRIATIIVVLAAIGAAVLAVKHAGKSVDTGSATAQFMVDGPRSAIGDLRQDTIPLVARAGVFAQFLTSTDLRNTIAHDAGIPQTHLVTTGPFPGDATTGSAPPPSAARGTQVLAEKDLYRLDFSAQTDLPLVTIESRAPSPGQAARLADTAVRSLQRYVVSLQTQENIRPDRRVVIRQLGAAVPQRVSGGSGKILAVVAFMAVLILGLLGIVVVGRMRSGPGSLAYYEDEYAWELGEEGLAEAEPRPVDDHAGRIVH